jgi:hypothetical protein
MQSTTRSAETCNVTRCDVGQATDSAHHATGDTGAGNRQQTTDNRQRAADTIRRTAMLQTTRERDHVQDTTGKCATDNMQRGICDGENATDDTQHATHMQHTTSRQHAPCSGQYAANNNDVQRARQHATDNRQRGQQAACVMRQTPRRRRQTTGNACNRQRASDSRRHPRGREHMRDATGNTRHRRISCAAGSGQRTTSSMREALYSTTSAQLGTDATHTMQHTTGAAACSKLT